MGCRPQHLGHSEGPQAVTHLGQDLLVEEGAENGTALGSARGAEAPTLAGEGEQALGLATDLDTTPSAFATSRATSRGPGCTFQKFLGLANDPEAARAKEMLSHIDAVMKVMNKPG